MGQPSSYEITQLLRAWSNRDHAAFEKLVPLVHNELHKLAGYHMRKERPGHILQTTALVQEVYIRLMRWQDVSWHDRANFFGVVSMLMRRVLVDYARRYPDLGVRLSFEDAFDIPYERCADLVALDDALTSLAVFDERKSRVVELRIFGGFSVKETAKALDMSQRNVARDWDFALAWLYRELAHGESKDPKAFLA